MFTQETPGTEGTGATHGTRTAAPTAPAAPTPVTPQLIGRWLTGAGILVTVVSIFGGVFPFFSAGVGLPLDGTADGVVTTWRVVLHVVPGIAGLLAGLYLVAWGRRRARDAATPLGDPAAKLVARATAVIGGWFAIGPYLWALVEPGRPEGTGGMAGTMTPGAHTSWLTNVLMPTSGTMPAGKMHTANCAFTMGVDHWAVGALVVLGALTALGAGLRSGPLASLGGAAPQ